MKAELKEVKEKKATGLKKSVLETTEVKSPIRLETQKKVEVVKKEFPVKREWSEGEQIAYRRFGKCQELQDKLLLDVYGNVEDENLEEIKTITLKVFRGGKLKFASCKYRFRHLDMLFYVCEHEVNDMKVTITTSEEDKVTHKAILTYIEEEQVLNKYNPILR